MLLLGTNDFKGDGGGEPKDPPPNKMRSASFTKLSPHLTQYLMQGVQ